MKVAKSIQDRHFALAGFLRKVLNLSADSAQDIACKIEHVITPELASRFRSLTQYIEDEVIANQMSRDSWETLISGHQTNDSDH